jgi:hypothetical protein
MRSRGQDTGEAGVYQTIFTVCSRGHRGRDIVTKGQSFREDFLQCNQNFNIENVRNQLSISLRKYVKILFKSGRIFIEYLFYIAIG